YTSIILLFVPKIVYLTDAYRKQVQKKMGIFFPYNKITIIPNGIEIEKYRTAHNKTLSEEFTHVAMISRFTPLRDHETLIRAIGEIKKIHPVKLSLAGDGDTRPRLEQLVRQLDLSNEV